MLLPTATFLYVLVICVAVSHGSNDEKIPLVRLAELQIEHCTEVSLCTLRVSKGILPNLANPCCNLCSCEKDCIGQGTCCPDYHLMNSIVTNISNSIAEFSDRLTNVNFTSITQKQLTCVYAGDSKFQSVYDRSKVTYKMITSCPGELNETQEISRKCNEPKSIDTFEYDLFIPVTSLKSGITYRNKYCLICNEELNETRDFVHWTSTMYCSFFGLGQENTISTPNDFFTQLLKGNRMYCHLVFSPNTDIVSNFEFNKCDVVDIETCPTGSDKLLNEICNSFHLPVTFHERAYKSVRFKNIACFLCNKKATFNPLCQIKPDVIFKNDVFGFELNIQQDKNNYVVQSEEHEHHVLNVDVIKQDSSVCGTGFIQNTLQSGQVIILIILPCLMQFSFL